MKSTVTAALRSSPVHPAKELLLASDQLPGVATAGHTEPLPPLPTELVGPGILRMARAQGQKTAPLERAFRACHIPLDVIPQLVMERTLNILPEYAARRGLPYGIAHALGTVEIG